MKTLQTRFGEVQYDPAQTICFLDGLVGFEHLRGFLVMPNRKEGPLFWIQSIDDPEIALVLTDPTYFFLDYHVEPSQEDCRKLGIEPGEACHVLVVVTVPSDRKITVNLAAPIFFAPSTNRAIQVILDRSDYKTRTPLPE